MEGARQGYLDGVTELAGTLPPHAIDTVLAAYRKEGARLAATARAVGLIERALRGEVFTPKTSPGRAGRHGRPRTAAADGAADSGAADDGATTVRPRAAAGRRQRRRRPRRWLIVRRTKAAGPEHGQPAARASTARSAVSSARLVA